MDRATVERLRSWAAGTFAGRERVQKDELLAAARDADLPPEAKRALLELPQASWSPDEMLELVGNLDRPQVRTRMDGPIDGVPGGGHEGEAEEP